VDKKATSHPICGYYPKESESNGRWVNIIFKHTDDRTSSSWTLAGGRKEATDWADRGGGVREANPNSCLSSGLALRRGWEKRVRDQKQQIPNAMGD
jgi:hypothetical protein